MGDNQIGTEVTANEDTNSTPTPKPRPTYPRWIVIYNIRTPGSLWIGKGVEFFDEEEPARKRGRETQGTSRAFYPPWDRQYLGAAQGVRLPVSLTDYLQEMKP